MTKWTDEQLDAINKEGQNIVVSAGAGSGKTAVLTERVIRKIKDGVDIKTLLVLTFTNEAAGEMKNRIRKALKKGGFKEQLDQLESAYITTFDSYALSVVKKYHYLLNVSPNISIVDSSIMNLKKKAVLNEIFDYKYNCDTQFAKLVSDFCYKDDEELKKYILKISKDLDLKINKQSYLENYIANNYNSEYIDDLVAQYEKLLLEKKEIILRKVDLLSNYVDAKYIELFKTDFQPLAAAQTYNEIKNGLNLSLPRLPNKSSDEAKTIKDEIGKLLKEANQLVWYQNEEEIKNTLLSTQVYVQAIVDIIVELDHKINEYKYQNDIYEFNDISKMAIQVIENNDEIRTEMINYYNEIMVDEYQDTNDLQDYFISLIQNNNLYMVGDIKQSIYRFRNANPDIFRSKYLSYAVNDGGLKIDLLKNFRSRREVLSNINEIFDRVMDDKIGSANYSESHQMIFGNDSYEKEGLNEQNHNLEIYNYQLEDKSINKEEVEAFIIANDIKEKVSSNYQILDKETNQLRCLKYSDISIIMDRGTEFDKYVKIFQYLQIPITQYKDESLTSENDILIIKNIILLIIKIKQKLFDQEFKYFFISVARSYLFSYDDDYIFNCFKEDQFSDNDLYRKAAIISQNINHISTSTLLSQIIEIFDFHSKRILVGDVEKSMIRIEYLQNISTSLSQLGYTPLAFAAYLDEMVESNDEIKYSFDNKAGNNIKLMNIHKSKGLEFSLCYYSGLYKTFNTRDLNEKFMADNKYGIVTPYYNGAIGYTIVKDLIKDKYLQAEISEKIRLFYVALTRCKEKMIIVSSMTEQEDSQRLVVNDEIRLNYRSFQDILNSVSTVVKPYLKNIDLNMIPLTKNYETIKTYNFKEFIEPSPVSMKKIALQIESSPIDEQRFSNNEIKLQTKEEKEMMELGTKLHYLFETVDFKQPLPDIKYKHKLESFLNYFPNINVAKIYKEYEFIYEKEHTTYHGKIDLIFEYDKYIDIVDYKLKYTDSDNYKKQLLGYKDYIETKSEKKVNLYLYSIVDEKLVAIL